MNFPEIAYGRRRNPIISLRLAPLSQAERGVPNLEKKTQYCARQPSPITQRVEQVLELPEGSLSGAARVELSGNRRAVVEGCRGILEYEEGVIRLNTTSGIVRFMGRDLTMNCLTEDSAVVSGTILSVEFLS